MDWSLLAGGLSKGITDAQQGMNQGLMQGEQVAQSRQSQDLAQQHLGMQQQQLTNALAQRAFQNAMAQQEYGLKQQHLAQQAAQLEQQGRYHEGMLQHYGADTELKRQMAPFQQRLAESRAKYFEERSRGGGGAGTAAERYKNGVATRMGYDSYLDAPPEVQAQINSQWTKEQPYGEQKLERYGDLHSRIGYINQLSQQMLAYPNMSGEERASLDLIRMKSQRLAGALNRIQMARNALQPPNPQDVATVQALDPNALEQDMVRLQNRVAARGANAVSPGSVPPTAITPTPVAPVGPQMAPRDAFMKQWGLK